MKKKVAIFGGSFNPIHNGQINVVNEVLKSGLVDEVWIMPCMKHQFDKELASDEARVDMISLVFGDVENVKVCREDLDFLGMSDMHSTINRLKRKYNYDFVWLAGSDLLYGITRLYKFKEVFEMIKFVIFERKGYPIFDVRGMDVVSVLSKNVSGVASKNIRLRILQGQMINRFVPVCVDKYIRDRGLYEKICLP